MKTVKSFVLSLALSALIGLPLLALPDSVAASSSELVLDRVQIDVRDQASLQSGARTFVNQCMGCHSASLMRYSKLRDIGLTDQQIKDNLLFAGEKVGEMMNAGMTRKDGKEWFGAAPPDLSVEARSRGAEWLYTYLRTYYRDDTKATGWNNLAFPGVAMPHVLWEMQGVREPQFETQSSHGQDVQVFKGWKQVSPGTLTPLEFDYAIADLVGYLQWMGEPAQNTRVRIGVWVLLFLGIFSFVAWRLNASFWKNVK